MAVDFVRKLGHVRFFNRLVFAIGFSENLNCLFLQVKDNILVDHPVGPEQISVQSFNTKTNFPISLITQQKILGRLPKNFLLVNFDLYRRKNLFSDLCYTLCSFQVETENWLSRSLFTNLFIGPTSFSQFLFENKEILSWKISKGWTWVNEQSIKAHPVILLMNHWISYLDVFDSI